VHLQCMSNFCHEIGELNEDENSVLLRDLVPEVRER
jgi:hypothetical protein